MQSRKKTISPGPIVPKPIIYPCTVNIDDNEIFVFGHEYIQHSSINNISILSYIYNKATGDWTDLSENFPCTKPINIYKYTCAYLRPSRSLIMNIGSGTCNPILNLTLYPNSWTWTLVTAPVSGGIVFNIDAYQEKVILIGNKRNNTESDIYMVITLMKYCMTFYITDTFLIR